MATTKTTPQEKSKGFRGVRYTFIIIILVFVVGWGLYNFILGDPANFANGDREDHPLNTLGTVYKGGWIASIIFGLLCTVIAMSVECWTSISAYSGKGSMIKSVENVEAVLRNGDTAKTEEFCHKQGGSVANMVLADLKPYREMGITNIKLKERVATVQSSHDEATVLEVSTMTMNLPIIATIITLDTLIALLGTMLGMICSFAALTAGSGANSVVFSTDISEALASTTPGVVTSWSSVVSHNYFTDKIDKLTFVMDETSYTIAHTFEEKYPEA